MDHLDRTINEEAGPVSMEAAVDAFIRDNNSILLPALLAIKDKIAATLEAKIAASGSKARLASIDLDDFQAAKGGEIWLDVGAYTARHTPLAHLRIAIAKDGKPYLRNIEAE